MTLTAKKWTLLKAFGGAPKLSDFELVEESISPVLKPGEIIVEAVYLSVDPYMRVIPVPLGGVMIGEQVGRVKVSKNPNYPEGTLVMTFLGWRSLTLIPDPDKETTTGPTNRSRVGSVVRKVPEFGDLPPSVLLGHLGMSGMTAYFGLLERGKPTAGETVLVSAAAGAVGHLVGQIAKIKGCTVIGSTGSQAKCDWLKELGFDHAFNYKETSVDDALNQFAPDGIDLYFDNVGGDFTFTVFKNHIKFCGRVVVCGAVSQYISPNPKDSNIYGLIIYKQLDVLGVIASAFKDRFDEGRVQMLQWTSEGKIKYGETITEGFEQMPQAFISIFSGGNMGKALVKA